MPHLDFLPIARSSQIDLGILPALANRHGLITGATGTGKTITLQVLAERFSQIGVPVFMADVKGDLSGLAASGKPSEKLKSRLDSLGLQMPDFAAFPVAFWDVFGKQGHPVRATINDMGPLLLARLLNLNETQEGVLQIAFKLADDEGLALLDIKDLRAMLQWVGEHASTLTKTYGNVSSASVGAILRGLLSLEEQGAEQFFGEPMLNIADLMQTNEKGLGVVNILAADALMNSPKLYATFLLWLLSELFENLPEVGDLDKPKLVFFFDEAHILFADAPKALIEKVEMVVRLIRSKGVGVYFVTQNPLDIPETILGQLGNRVQHALRAFTPRDQKAVKVAAETMRPNPGLDIESAITELSVGEALLSFLDAKGAPSPTSRAFILPPQSQFGPIESALRTQLIQNSLVAGVYEQAIDSESAYERLRSRTEASVHNASSRTEASVHNASSKPAISNQGSTQPTTTDQASSGGVLSSVTDFLFGKKTSSQQSLVETVAKTAIRAAGSQIGRQVGQQIVRGVLGSLMGGGSRRR